VKTSPSPKGPSNVVELMTISSFSSRRIADSIITGISLLLFAAKTVTKQVDSLMPPLMGSPSASTRLPGQVPAKSNVKLKTVGEQEHRSVVPAI
jgi:hypothetical protein